MNFIVRWAPEAKPAEQPDKNAIVGRTKSARQNLLAGIVSIGLLMLITGAILGILDPLPKKGATRHLESAYVNAQNVRQGALDVGSRPASLDRPETITSDDAFSTLPQGAVTRGLPVSPYQPPLTTKPARGQHRLSAMIQKPRHTQNTKTRWPKAFIMYLDAHHDYLKKILRHKETASPMEAH